MDEHAWERVNVSPTSTQVFRMRVASGWIYELRGIYYEDSVDPVRRGLNIQDMCSSLTHVFVPDKP